MTIEIEKRIEALEARLAESDRTIAHLHALIAPVSRAAGETMRAARASSPFAQARVDRRNAAIDLEVAAFAVPERLASREQALHLRVEKVRRAQAAADAESAEIERIGLGPARASAPSAALRGCLESRAWCEAVVLAFNTAEAKARQHRERNADPGPVLVVIGDVQLMRGRSAALPSTENAPRGVVWTGALAGPSTWLPEVYESNATRGNWAAVAALPPPAEGCIRVLFDTPKGTARFDVVDLTSSDAYLERPAKLDLECDAAELRAVQEEVDALRARLKAGG